MRLFARTALIAATLGASAAAAQTGGTPVETSPVPLSAEKQAIVRKQAQQASVPAAQPGEPVTVGTTLPEGIALWSLPQDSVSEVPAVTSYKFLLTGKSIAVVDPDSRKVIQMIPK